MKRIDWSELRPQISLVWRLSLPAILTQITTIAMQYIDSAMVGALGANASAAIGLVSTSTWLLSGITYAITAGFSVQVAHHIGAKRDEDARTVVKHGLISALLISALLCALGAVISDPLPVWLGGSETIHRDASLYFLVFALELPFLQLNSLASSFLQCSGDMVTPSILTAAMCILDIIFNAIFIPKYGVLGAGIGTALACAVVCLVMLWCCCGRDKHLKLNRADKSRFDSSILKKALKIGLPVAVQEVATSGAMVITTMIIAPLGEIAIAANSFAVTAEGLCYMPGYGIGSAAATVVGRSVGAGEDELARRYGNICIGMGATIMGVLGLIMMFICPLLFAMLTPDPAVRELSAQVLRIELLAEPLFGASIVAAGALRGAGDTLVPSVINLATMWVVRIGLALILIKPLGLLGMWIAMAAELSTRGLLMLYRQRTSRFYAMYAGQSKERLSYPQAARWRRQLPPKKPEELPSGF